MQEKKVVNRKELDRIITFNNHAVAMSKIAISLLVNENPLDVKGVRELLAMYLLIPYITNTQLDIPDKHNIPKLDTNELFTKVINQDGSLAEMTLDNLRNAICHSFAALTEFGDVLVDDRASYDRKTHSALTDKGFCSRLESHRMRRRLLELHSKVLEQQINYNDNLLKGSEVSNG